MSDSDSTNEGDVPPREVCEARCQEFATVTGTDTALAMFFLQDRDWDIERALNAFFETSGSGSTQPSAGKTMSVTTNHSTDSSSCPPGASAEPAAAADMEPHRIRLLSWNIDGLDANNIKTRTKAVCDIINREKPDVVYLQEVVPQTLDMLEQHCPGYLSIAGNTRNYFAAVLLRLNSVTCENHQVVPFYSSMMERNLIKVKAVVKGLPVVLMTSHLESTKDHSEERKKQLRVAWKEMKDAESRSTVIFGGDLNLRDKEVDEMGGVPENILDLWEVTGKRKEAKFTWDVRRNDNLEWNLKFRPQCRFDRLYMRHSSSHPALKAVYFELVGIERIKSCRRFPSDHWGILAHFDKTVVKSVR